MPEDVEVQIQNCLSLKPKELVISDLKWKYLVRSVLRSKNIMMIGPSGCAKTMAAHMVADVMKRPFDKFNIGSTQDARAVLIGNTTYNKEHGTVFHKSAFVKAITTPNSVILLDELTRGTHDAWNILMHVTDPMQRCIRLDEDENSTLIKVAEGVTFIATANIGTEYTATKVLDKAISRRFTVKLEMPLLNKKELLYLFSVKFKGSMALPEEKEIMKQLADIYEDIIAQYKLEDSQLEHVISPANMVEMAELILDGFSLPDIAEAAIYPEYTDEAERELVKSILQKYIPVNVASPINDPLAGKPSASF